MSAEEQPRAERECHLRDEARERRPEEGAPERQRLELLVVCWIGEVDEVEVGREVVSVVETV